MSESSHELAQLSFLVQVKRDACVTFPLCAVKVTHGSGAISNVEFLVQVYGHAAAKPDGNAGRSPPGRGGHQK
ncbi:hypothetical protein ACVUCS_003103 [Salmonella enterica subsp. enterica]